MDDEPHITLDIPDPEDFEPSSYTPYIPVPASVVESGIELLQCFVSQWKRNAGSEPDDDVWDRLAVSAAQMLSGLMGAWAAYYHDCDAEAVVATVARFCDGDYARQGLEALRGRRDITYMGDLDYIVDALLPLCDETQRRREERLAQARRRMDEDSERWRTGGSAPRAVSSPQPAADDDVGWDF